VAADAANDTGMAMAISNGGQQYSLIGTNGTSAAAPLWAAMIALADQYAHRSLGFVNPAIYRIGRSPSYHKAFHDITTGTNTVTDHQLAITITGYRAATGWDPATGWGSPQRPTARPSARPLRQPRSQPGVAYNGWRDHQLTANPLSTRRVAGTPSIGSRTRSCACEAACSSIMRN
jgi:hypothetical protein